MRKIDYIVVHCTATPQTTTVASIQNYWKNTLKWKNPGYHHIVLPNGNVATLAQDSQICNGVAGHNSNSIHISYIGGIDSKGNGIDNRTPQQKITLVKLIREYKEKYPKAKVQGHRDFSPDKNKNGRVDPWEYIKICPSFNAIPEYADIVYEKVAVSNPSTYTVKAGDNLTKIAQNNNTTILKLKQLNNLNSDMIRVGQILKLK